MPDYPCPPSVPALSRPVEVLLAECRRLRVEAERLQEAAEKLKRAIRRESRANAQR